MFNYVSLLIWNALEIMSVTQLAHIKLMQWVNVVLCGSCRYSFNHWKSRQAATWKIHVRWLDCFWNFLYIYLTSQITLKRLHNIKNLRSFFVLLASSGRKTNSHYPLLSSFYSLTFRLLKQKLQLTCHLLAVKRGGGGRGACIYACVITLTSWLVSLLPSVASTACQETHVCVHLSTLTFMCCKYTLVIILFYSNSLTSKKSRGIRTEDAL